MRPACLPLVFALVLAGCSRGPAFREVRIQPSSGVTTVRGDGAEISSETLSRARAERVVIEAAASTEWMNARLALVEVTDMGAVKSVTLEEGTRRVTVRLPRGAQPTRGDAWIVDVGAGGEVRFGTRETSVEALEAQAREVGTPPSWFLVRGDERATFGDVMTTLATLERLAPGRVVLGALTAAMTPKASWSCPAPPGREHDDATAAVMLAVRDDGKVGVVRITAATDPEIAVAVVF